MYVATMCPECSLKPQCTKQEYRTVEIDPDDHKLRQAALDAKETPEHKEAMKERLLIEGGFGHIKEHHTLRRARYRGLKPVRIQQLMACTAHNIEKLVRYGAKEKPKAQAPHAQDSQEGCDPAKPG